MKKSICTVYTVSLGTLLLLIPACDMPGKLNTMNSSTSSMNSTTKDLLGTTNQMKSSTDSLISKMDAQLSKTDELTDLERQGGSVEIRRNALEGMKKAHSAGDKLAQASIYFQSFEFQTFTGVGQDQTLAKRDSLFTDALNEFFMKLNEFNADVPEVSPFAMKLIEKSPSFLEYSQTNQQACFDALASTMHMVNRKQLENINSLKSAGSSLNLETASIYSLIVAAMVQEKAVNAGTIPVSQLAEWQKVVLTNHKLALRLLQARHNMILGIVLGQIIPDGGAKDKPLEAAVAANDLIPKGDSMLGTLMTSLLGGVDMVEKLIYSWDLDLDKMNVVEMQTFQEYLQVVLDTRAVLKTQLHEPLQINKFLQQYLESARIKSLKPKGAVEAAARTQFVGIFNQVRSNK